MHHGVSKKCALTDKLKVIKTYRPFMQLKIEKHVTHAIGHFTITAKIHSRSLVNFYCQYAERHMNLKFMRRVREREREIRQFAIVKNKLMSVFNASLLLLTMNFVITLSK